MVVINRKDIWWHLGLSENRGSSNPPIYEYVHVFFLFQNCYLGEWTIFRHTS